MSDHATNLKAAAKVETKLEKIETKSAAKISKIEAAAKVDVEKVLADAAAARLELVNSLTPEVAILLSTLEL